MSESKLDRTDLKIPILSTIIWCPFCKESIGSGDPFGCEIKCIQISSNDFGIYIEHKKCAEEFRISIPIQSISYSVEGKVKYVQ